MNWTGILTTLQDVALDADQRRLSVFVDQFQIEHPDIYDLIYDAADLPVDQALQLLTDRWPALIFVKLHPNHQQIISALQTEIQKRKDNHEQ